MIGLRLLVDIINRPIITNTCLPKRSHKSLHRKLVPILLVVYGAANRDIETNASNQSESEILSHLLELMLVVAREILDNRQIQE